MTKVAVLGSGSWGTALAKSLADAGQEVRLWARRAEQAERIQSERENADYLPGAKLPATLRATHDLESALAGVDMILSAVPTHGLRDNLGLAVPFFPKGVPILSATKGIEQETLKLVCGIFEDCIDAGEHAQLTYLGGPSFAKEVAQGMPTAVVVAGKSHSVTAKVQHILATERLRVYTSDDVVGIELGGSLKNVMAIAAGIGDGLGFGHNTRAAIVTRGLAELSRMAIKMGAHPMTLAGLGGIGDLLLTCTGDLSRNRKVGLELGRGKSLDEILKSMNQVAEGVRTTKSAHDLSRREGVEMPIVDAVYRILYQDMNARDAVFGLMTRPQRHERD